MTTRNKLVTKNNKNEIDYLSEDPLIRSQQFSLISFVGPNLKQKCKINAFKVKENFGSVEEAQKKIKYYQDLEPEFDIFVAPVGVWCPFNPDPDDIENQEYGNDQLNELMKGYHENKAKTDQHFNQRKKNMIEEAMKDGTQEGQKELSEIIEHPIAVKQRMSDLVEQLEAARENIEKINKNIAATQLKLDNDYTPTELETADKEFEEFKNRTKEATTKDTIAEIQEELRIKYTEYEKLRNKSTTSTTTDSGTEKPDPWMQAKNQE